ncbi:MAG: TolC family protein [Bdellovibrionales bacterium]|nr:TolC family protein [Bdellovibrionales bacterium]
MSGTTFSQSVPKGLYIQEDAELNEKTEFKPLSLTDVIEQGLRKNYDQVDRKMGLESLKLSWDETWETFWLPQVEFNLATNPQRVARLRRGDLSSTRNRSTSGFFELELGNYTLFNRGKDFLLHQNNKDQFIQDKRNLSEDRRFLRFQLIEAYFELLYLNDVLEFTREQLQQASFVYRYNREKISLRKITRQEYYQSRTLYLKAQNDYQQAKINKENKDEAIALLIVDKPGTRYLLKDEMRYQRISYPLQSALEMGERDARNVLDAKVDVKQAQRELKLARLLNLPLPQFDLNLGAYTHTFGPATHESRYDTNLDGSNLDIVASDSATWTLFGTNGLLNGRRTDQRALDRQRTFNRLFQAINQVKTGIQQSYINIKFLENHIRVLEARVPTVKKMYDSTLDNYLSKKTSFINFQDTLEQMVETQSLMSQYKYLHMRSKLGLSELIGKENIPGENFEKR